MKILITGGAGYIGSFLALHLLLNSHEVIVFDSLERGFQQALEAVENISGKKIKFIKGDIKFKDQIYNALKENLPDIVFHLAAYKSVSESEKFPHKYLENNVLGSRNLFDSMIQIGIKKVFVASTGSIYGNNPNIPFTEETKASPINLYAKTKLEMENILDSYIKLGKLQGISFRFFNVIGANEEGLLGESPKYTTNLVPIVMQVLSKKREYMFLFGNNFNTKDGTQERDYIDVNDIAIAHLKALDYDSKQNELEIFNLSTGKSTSCLEIFKIAEEITNTKLTYKVADPRKGDPEVLLASNLKAKTLLNWEPKISIRESIKSHWLWINRYPEGYNY